MNHEGPQRTCIGVIPKPQECDLALRADADAVGQSLWRRHEAMAQASESASGGEGAAQPKMIAAMLLINKTKTTLEGNAQKIKLSRAILTIDHSPFTTQA